MFGKERDFTSVGPLIDGLPAPSGTMIIAKLLPEGFNIKALIGKNKNDWQTFELSIEKIERLHLINEKEIQQIIEQSAPGMILGAAAFGVLGAMVGGRTKTKEKVKIKTLFVIDYLSGEKKQIVLDVSNNLKDTERVIKRFHEMKPESNQPRQPIEL